MPVGDLRNNWQAPKLRLSDVWRIRFWVLKMTKYLFRFVVRAALTFKVP
jgi:hypothetical protein